MIFVHAAENIKQPNVLKRRINGGTFIKIIQSPLIDCVNLFLA